jgi:DNA-binding MarR family transcriptional regulator
MSAQLLAEHGLTINDYECLLHLSHAPDGAMRRIDLANRLVLTPSGVTRLLDGLQASGYVCKGDCSSDARVSYAVLTEAGRKKLEESSQSHLAAVAELFGELFTVDEISTLAELLGRFPGAALDSNSCSPGHA